MHVEAADDVLRGLLARTYWPPRSSMTLPWLAEAVEGVVDLLAIGAAGAEFADELLVAGAAVGGAFEAVENESLHAGSIGNRWN